MKKEKRPIMPPNSPIGYIYKLKNHINGKIYIGQTLSVSEKSIPGYIKKYIKEPLGLYYEI